MTECRHLCLFVRQCGSLVYLSMFVEKKKAEPLDAPLPGIIGESPAMREVYRLTRLVAPTTASVLLVGETGTGKEVIARALHNLSDRNDGPYVRVNCVRPERKPAGKRIVRPCEGAFTGAIANRRAASRPPTPARSFLDEINSTNPQAAGQTAARPAGARVRTRRRDQTIRVDSRVIAASNRDLLDGNRKRRFREDLYYRLNVVPIQLPPLRERP